MVSLMPVRGMSTKVAPGVGGGGAKAGAAGAAAAAAARSPLFSDPYRPDPCPVEGLHVRALCVCFCLCNTFIT